MSVWLPTWSVDLVGRRASRSRDGAAGCRERERRDQEREAILLAREDHQREVVAGRCALAACAGVRVGMTVAHARALLGGARGVALRVERHDEAGDARALRALAQWAIRFSPRVAPDGADGLLIDVTGCERLYRGERRLINAVANSIERLGFRCRVAIAPTFGAAWAMARFGEGTRIVLEDGALEASLAPLPVRALRVDDQTIEMLGEVGVERVGEVMELPRDALPSRFGDGLLLGLDRALGRAIEVIEPVRASAPVEASRVFDGPVRRLEGVEACVRELLGLLCAQLERAESGVRRLSVVLERSDLEPLEMVFELSRPSRDERHLWSLVRVRLERAQLGFGVDRVVVRAGGRGAGSAGDDSAIGRLAHRQGACWIGSEDDEASMDAGRGERLVGELVDTLVSRVGRERVTRLEAAESHEPGRAYRRSDGATPTLNQRSDQGVGCAGRPSVLFERGEHAQVLAVTPDGPPYRVWWRGEMMDIVASVGPERIGGEWWKKGSDGATERRSDEGGMGGMGGWDYFRVQTDGGRWLWVCRGVGSRSGGAWFVRGEWV